MLTLILCIIAAIIGCLFIGSFMLLFLKTLFIKAKTEQDKRFKTKLAVWTIIIILAILAGLEQSLK